MFQRGFQPRMMRPVEEADDVPPVPRRKCTAIYERDPSRGAKVVVKPQGPKLVRDKLLDLMSDSQYHSAHELETLLPHGEWVRAMKELLALRFAFDRLSNSFRIRHRLSAERKQVLVELIAGIDATKPEGVVDFDEEILKTVPSKRKVSPLESFDPTKDEEELPPEEDRMKLSQSADELVLSAMDCSTMTAAILAKKGSGKTYLGMVLVEEFMRCLSSVMPVVVIDPTGVWYGLRSMSDGGPSSFGMLILGGAKGDLEIGPKQGSQAADVLIAIKPRPIILDLSGMLPTEQHEFVADFAQRLYVASVRLPLHMFVDEADEFAPQFLNSSSRHQKRSLEAIDRIVRRGRNKGIGVTLITQRTAVIAKNVLSQTDSLFLMNLSAPADLEAVDSWMRRGVKPEQRLECLAQLVHLPRGTAYFMQTGDQSRFRRFVVRKRDTFDSSFTLKPDLKPGAAVDEIRMALIPEDVLEVARKILGTGFQESQLQQRDVDHEG